jgi:hypothetical protein
LHEENIQKSLSKLDASFYLVCSADEKEINRLNSIISGETSDELFIVAQKNWYKKHPNGQSDDSEELEIGIYRYQDSAKDNDDMWSAHHNYRKSVLQCFETYSKICAAVENATQQKLRCNQGTCIVLSTTQNMLSKERETLWHSLSLPKYEKNDVIDSDESQVQEITKLEDSSIAEKDTSAELPARRSLAPLPLLPTCSSIIRESFVRICPEDEARAAINAMLDIRGSKSGIPWIRVNGIISSDGVLHAMVQTENKQDFSSTEEFAMRSIALRGSEIVVHSSDTNLFPMMIEIIPRTSNTATAIIESVMQSRFVVNFM